MYTVTIDPLDETHHIFRTKLHAFEFVMYDSLYCDDIRDQQDFFDWMDECAFIDYRPVYLED